jgi:dipeptidase D
MNVSDLKPELLWNFFHQINQVPRPSKREGKMVDFLFDFAKKQGLDIKSDAAKNVLIRKPATPGKENLKTVILQSHLDMVCEKNDPHFNFETDPVLTYIEDGWVKAKGTTLGADDGIGIAAALSLLASDKIEHGPIQCLFTTDEETGLTGAFALDKEYLQGDILINLDSEEWGEFCIGCAGGKNVSGTFLYNKVSPAPSGYFWLEVKVGGLVGGHSGSDIHVGLGNANKILVRYLWTLSQKSPLLIAEIDGGNLSNAIARDARALVGIPSDLKEDAIVLLNVLQAEVSSELKWVDKDVRLSIRSVEVPAYHIDSETGKRLINVLYALPHGVIGMSHEIEGLVETSTNLASVKMKDHRKIVVTTSQRSSTDSLKIDIVNTVKTVFDLGQAEIQETEGYPGWKPNPDSEIRSIAETVFENLFNEKPKIIAIHAGLECGLFFKKNQGLDMISCGPTILGAHSPNERLEIETVEKWWDFLLALLKVIPVK